MKEEYKASMTGSESCWLVLLQSRDVRECLCAWTVALHSTLVTMRDLLPSFLEFRVDLTPLEKVRLTEK